MKDRKGDFFEVDTSGNTVWEYVNPVANSGITHQGNIGGPNEVFRAERYSIDYAGLSGQSLTPQGYIETGSTFTCSLFTNTVEVIHKNEIALTIYPNPARDNLTISADKKLKTITIVNIAGQNVMEVFSQPPRDNAFNWSTSEWTIFCKSCDG